MMSPTTKLRTPRFSLHLPQRTSPTLRSDPHASLVHLARPRPRRMSHISASILVCGWHLMTCVTNPPPGWNALQELGHQGHARRPFGRARSSALAADSGGGGRKRGRGGVGSRPRGWRGGILLFCAGARLVGGPWVRSARSWRSCRSTSAYGGLWGHRGIAASAAGGALSGSRRLSTLRGLRRRWPLSGSWRLSALRGFRRQRAPWG